MKGNRSASVRYPVTWKKRVLYIHNDASVLHFCHYYSPINATDTLLSLKYQKAKLETVIALYNEVFTTCVRITICQTNFLDNNMVCCAKRYHRLTAPLVHQFPEYPAQPCTKGCEYILQWPVWVQEVYSSSGYHGIPPLLPPSPLI